MRRTRAEEPVLITTAAESSDEQFDRRRKKYAVMMALRAVCVIAAACTYRVSVVLALLFVVGGIVLPWCAVIIANDGPAKKRARKVERPGASAQQALPSGADGRTLDG
jgi:Protein of unknown function (DUF3099)